MSNGVTVDDESGREKSGHDRETVKGLFFNPQQVDP